MNMSEVIENFIKRMLMHAEGETIDLQRNELASQLGCVPSQINYVISTRFTGEKGYIVESRRGGGGYIRISRMQLDKSDYLMHIINSMGDSITASEAAAYAENCFEKGYLTEREAQIILSAVSDAAVGIAGDKKDEVRARILKNMLMRLR